MSNFFTRLFTKKSGAESHGAKELVEQTLSTLLSLSQLELDFVITESQEKVGHFDVNLSGPDDEALKSKEGQLLDAIQLLLTRILQHQLPDERISISVDCAGFREESNQSLMDLADKLKDMALDKGKPVYFRALPPRDRKVVHQHLAQDGRVKSRSIGDGLFKKIKIYPNRGDYNSADASDYELHER